MAFEDDLLRALLGIGELRLEERFTVARLGAEVFSFTMRALSQKEVYACRDRHTRGGRLDYAGYHSALIYLATLPEDRKSIWDNKAAWAKYGAVTGEDMVEALLLAGEKERCLARLRALSGYLEEKLEDAAKN